MKVLHFTHSQDIDGINSIILTRKAFKDYKVVPTKTFDITKNVKQAIEDKSIYDYDIVFVTDLCIKEPVLSQIDQDEVLKNKIIVLDHHQSEIDEGNDKYSFVNIVVDIDGVKTCGTSLYYSYLKEHHYIEPSNILEDLVEWTREYDVWDWKVFNNYEARKLHILFEVLGMDKYLILMNMKVDNYDKILFNDFESKMIQDFEDSVESYVKEALEKMSVKELVIDGIKYRIGYIKCLYKYRNDVNEFVISDNKNDIDAVGMVMEDLDTVSYRRVKEVDVSKIGAYFGGKGHKAAASNLQNNEKYIAFMNS